MENLPLTPFPWSSGEDFNILRSMAEYLDPLGVNLEDIKLGEEEGYTLPSYPDAPDTARVTGIEDTPVVLERRLAPELFFDTYDLSPRRSDEEPIRASGEDVCSTDVGTYRTDPTSRTMNLMVGSVTKNKDHEKNLAKPPSAPNLLFKPPTPLNLARETTTQPGSSVESGAPAKLPVKRPAGAGTSGSRNSPIKKRRPNHSEPWNATPSVSGTERAAQTSLTWKIGPRLRADGGVARAIKGAIICLRELQRHHQGYSRVTRYLEALEKITTPTSRYSRTIWTGYDWDPILSVDCKTGPVWREGSYTLCNPCVERREWGISGFFTPVHLHQLVPKQGAIDALCDHCRRPVHTRRDARECIRCWVTYTLHNDLVRKGIVVNTVEILETPSITIRPTHQTPEETPGRTAD